MYCFAPLARGGYTWSFAVAMLFAVTANEARATNGLRLELAEIAQTVAPVIKQRSGETIAIGAFTGPPGVTSGPLVQQILKEEFEKQGFTVKLTAPISVGGEIFLEETSSGLLTHLTVALRDSFGRMLFDLSLGDIQEGKIDRAVVDEETLVQLLQPTVNVPTDLPEVDRANLITASLTGTEEQPFVDGTRLFATRSSPYAVEVLVDGQPRALRLEGNLVLVDLKRGEQYEVRLINDSDFDAAAALSIDGLNSFTFSEVRQTVGPGAGQPSYGRWILAPRSQAVIRGWHKRDTGPGNVDAFLITEYADSAAAVVNQQSGVGTISVSFAAAWEGDEPPAGLNEPPSQPRGLPDGTGFGEAKDMRIGQPVVRNTGVLRANLSIRYSKGE